MCFFGINLGDFLLGFIQNELAIKFTYLKIYTNSMEEGVGMRNWKMRGTKCAVYE
jgi:hypothetical protein